jgi:hypothetical protein
MINKTILTAFFDANVTSVYDEKNVKEIVGLLNKHSCNVVQTIMATDWGYSVTKSKKAAENIYTQKIKDIKESDIFVCDMSNPSPTLAFEVFEALNIRKPSLLLFNKNVQSPDIAFSGNPSRYLTIEVFDNNLEEIISKYLKKAQAKKPISRFSVRLTKEMGDYLNYLKAKMKLSSKNDVITNILEEMINEDYDFIKSYQ